MAVMEPTKRPPTFSVRFEPEVMSALRDLARRQETSMNQVLTSLVLRASGDDEITAADPKRNVDLADGIVLDALRDHPSAIGAVIGCGRFLYGRGLTRTAALVWKRAAELIEADPDPERGGVAKASDELTRIAREMRRARDYRLAIEFAKRAVETNPLNRRAGNLAGQWLVGLGQRQLQRGDLEDARSSFDEASNLLREVRQLDNFALLHFGLAQFEVAQMDGDSTKRTMALADVGDAMKRWAFGTRDQEDRASWLFHISRLRSKGESHLADELVEFANSNAEWGTISASDERGPAGDYEL